MPRHLPPLLDRQNACICSRGASALGAVISAYFKSPRVYFPIFAFPSVEHPDSGQVDEKSDAWFSNYLGRNAAVVISNAIARQKPTRVFIAGLSEMQMSYVRPRIPTSLMVEIATPNDIQPKLEPLGRIFDGLVECRTSDLVQGLLTAKYLSKELRVNENAPPLRGKVLSGKKGLVVVEVEGGVEEIATSNYAFSIQADLVAIPKLTKDELYPIQRLVHEWKLEGSTSAHNRLKEMVIARVGDIDFASYEFATFVTRGLPYGLLLDNVIPFTHVLSDVACDQFIFSNVAFERTQSHFGSALVFSPGAMDDEETNDVVRSLGESRFGVTGLLNERATVKALSNYGDYYPFDLMHICSHGGEINGYHVKKDFLDRDGNSHRVEFDEVVGFSPATRDRVLVSRKAIFRRFDGLKWMSPELEQLALPKYVFVDMKNALHLDSKAGAAESRVPIREPIYGSCHILCYDSIHQGEFLSLSGSGWPFIFNNTCSSWYEIATSFISAGARAYLGTIWEIRNVSAVAGARAFYKELLSRELLLDAFSATLKALPEKEDRGIYIFWGLHFSTLKSPSRKSNREVLNRLSASFRSISEAFNRTSEPALRRGYAMILDFLYDRIVSQSTGQQQVRLKAISSGLRLSIRSALAVSFDDDSAEDVIEL